MTDEFYRKQLEAFGIEQTRIVEDSLETKRQDEFRERMQGVTKMLMSTAQGREWMAHKLDVTLAFTPPFSPGKPDYSAFLAGAQAVGLTMFREVMAACPEKFYDMIVEANAKKSNITPATDEAFT